MRLLHTSDLHFGFALGGVSLLREQEVMADTLLEIAREQRVNGVLLAGDIFDRAAASAEAIALYDCFMTKLTALCPVFVIAGNHDGAARLASLHSLLAASGLFIAGSLRDRPQPMTLGDIEIWLIPYFNLEQVRLLYPEHEMKTYENAMHTLMDDVRARRDTTRRTIVMAHCFVTGAALSDSDGAAVLGGAQQIGASVFEGIDYVALGHLHRAQQPAANVRYSGSPYPYSFSEGEKSVCIYDSETNLAQNFSLTYPRRLRTLRGTFEEIFALADSEDYLKIELTDRGAGLETLSLLRDKFPRLIALIGKAPEGGDAVTLTTAELESISPRELVCRFCEEIGGEPAKEVFVDAMMDALMRAEQGEDTQ